MKQHNKSIMLSEFTKTSFQHCVEAGFCKASVGGLLVIRENKTATNFKYPLL